MVAAYCGLSHGNVFWKGILPLDVSAWLLYGAGNGDESNQKFRQMYQYHKIGCPIAWMQGALNRISLLKIKVNADTCKSCGLCDKQCYITSLEPEKYSLYKVDKKRPGAAYACSKCLSCVSVCPNGSLRYNGRR